MQVNGFIRAVLGWLVVCVCGIAAAESGSSHGPSGPPAAEVHRPARAWSVLRREAKLPPGRQAGSSLGGGLVPGRMLPELLEAAPRVVRGTMLKVEEAGYAVILCGGNEIEATAYTASFQVAGSVKGATAEPGSELRTEFYLPFVGPAWAALAPGEHGLLLLAEDGLLWDLYHPLIPVDPRVPAITGATTTEIVGCYLLESLSPDLPLPTLESSIEGLLQLHTDGTADRLVQLGTSENGAVRGEALLGLVKLEDMRAFPAAVDLVLAIGPSDGGRIAWRIASAVQHLSRPELMDQVVPLCSSQEAEWRRAGLAALGYGARKYPASRVKYGPIFAAALKDEDPRVAYHGVMGLWFVNEAHEYPWGPTLEMFMQEPDKYLAYWRSWWETEGKARYGTPEAK